MRCANRCDRNCGARRAGCRSHPTIALQRSSTVLASMPGGGIAFATHGVAFSGSCWRGQRAVTLVGADQGMAVSALVLSRTAMKSDAASALLGADEIGALDLAGTRWVVLSACETALGREQSGEGVFGLRRAFRIAGADTVVMSLWPVQDSATADWMHALYDARLRGGKSTIDAVAHAQRATLAARRAAGKSDHPYYWAAFISAGDWR